MSTTSVSHASVVIDGDANPTTASRFMKKWVLSHDKGQ